MLSGLKSYFDLRRKECPRYIIYRSVAVYKWEVAKRSPCTVMLNRSLSVMYWLESSRLQNFSIVLLTLGVSEQSFNWATFVIKKGGWHLSYKTRLKFAWWLKKNVMMYSMLQSLSPISSQNLNSFLVCAWHYVSFVLLYFPFCFYSSYVVSPKCHLFHTHSTHTPAHLTPVNLSSSSYILMNLYQVLIERKVLSWVSLVETLLMVSTFFRKGFYKY